MPTVDVGHSTADATTLLGGRSQGASERRRSLRRYRVDRGIWAHPSKSGSAEKTCGTTAGSLERCGYSVIVLTAPAADVVTPTPSRTSVP